MARIKNDYTYADLHGKTVKELKSILGKMNKEARKRAKLLKEKGYTGKMSMPELKAIRGLKKVDLESAILDYAQAYLRDPRSTIKGMRQFEKRVLGTLKEKFDVNLKRAELDDFVDYLEGIGELWGSLKYPSANAVETYDEMVKQGIAGEEINKAFKDFLETGGKGRKKQKGLESKLLDLKEVLEDANKKGYKVTSSDDVKERLKELKEKKQN